MGIFTVTLDEITVFQLFLLFIVYRIIFIIILKIVVHITATHPVDTMSDLEYRRFIYNKLTSIENRVDEP